MKVLLVDDSEMIQERIGYLVENSEAVRKLYKAFNVNEAKSLLSEKKVDVAIIDVRMPDGTGFELLDYLKKEFSDIMTIMITNYPFNQYKAKAKEMGVNYFFSKQNDFELIEPTLQQLKLARQILNLN